MIRVNLINGIIVLGSDGNDLLTMKQMTRAQHAELMELGLIHFRDETVKDVRERFAEVNPQFASATDHDVALRLVVAKYREFPGTTGIQKDTGLRSNESR